MVERDSCVPPPFGDAVVSLILFIIFDITCVVLVTIDEFVFIEAACRCVVGFVVALSAICSYAVVAWCSFSYMRAF